MKKSSGRNVFLTGASSGIGQATAELLLRRGFSVWGTSRELSRLSAALNFHPIGMDLSDPRSIEHGWLAAVAQAERIDIVIQNAGAGAFGAIEEVSSDLSRELWQILVEGPRQLLQLAAAHLRPRREGLIIGVSSLAAELPMPFSTHYSAGKAALSALLAGLQMELQPFGVRVIDLRPGDIRTAFNDQLPVILTPQSPYARWARRAWQETEKLMKEAPEPELVAREVVRLIEGKSRSGVVRVGSFFQAILGPLGLRLLSGNQMRNSIRRYYGLHRIDDEQRSRD